MLVVAGGLYLAFRPDKPIQHAGTTPQDTFAPSSGPTFGEALGVVGDSFTSTEPTFWPAILAECLGDTLAISPVGGTGFFAKGPAGKPADPYDNPTRVKAVAAGHPSIVVMETAYNDSWHATSFPSQVAHAIERTVAAYRAQLPNAHFVFVGPFWPKDPLPRNITQNVHALQVAAKKVGALYLDASQWLRKATFFGVDGYHPSVTGHQYIAYRIAKALASHHLISAAQAAASPCVHLPNPQGSGSPTPPPIQDGPSSTPTATPSG